MKWKMDKTVGMLKLSVSLKIRIQVSCMFCQDSDDPSPAGPGVIVPGVLLKPGEVKKVKETNGFI